MKKNKRLIFTTIALGVNFFLILIGILKNVDLSSLGTAIAMINSPLYAYVLGETIRPSGLKKNNLDEIKK